VVAAAHQKRVSAAAQQQQQHNSSMAEHQAKNSSTMTQQQQDNNNNSNTSAATPKIIHLLALGGQPQCPSRASLQAAVPGEALPRCSSAAVQSLQPCSTTAAATTRDRLKANMTSRWHHTAAGSQLALLSGSSALRAANLFANASGALLRQVLMSPASASDALSGSQVVKASSARSAGTCKLSSSSSSRSSVGSRPWCRWYHWTPWRLRGGSGAGWVEA